MRRREIIIKDTHRGLWYEDGKLLKVLEAARYLVPWYINLGFYRRPRVDVTMVDVRERDLTIKGQEILTGDKVAKARTKAEVQRIEAESSAEYQRRQAETDAENHRQAARAEADAQRVRMETEVRNLEMQEKSAGVYAAHPALLRLRELETLRQLAANANARIYIGFDKHMANDSDERA